MRIPKWSATLVLAVSITLSACARHGETSNDGATVRVLGDTGRYSQVAWSPDGQLLAAIHADAKGYERIVTIDTSGKVISSTDTLNLANSPGWLHGSVSLLKWRAKDGDPELQVWSTGGIEPLMVVPGANRASWSRDGNWAVVVRSFVGMASTELWLVELKSKEMRPVWQGATAQRVRLSPSGKYLAFTNTQSSAVSMKNLETGDITELLRVPHPGQAIAGLAWSPDEQFLGVRRVGGGKLSGFYVINTEGPPEARLLTRVDMVDPDWHPSGDFLAYNTVGSPGRNELHVLELPKDWRNRILQGE